MNCQPKKNSAGPSNCNAEGKKGSSNNDDNSDGGDVPVVEHNVQQADASCELPNTPKPPMKYTKHDRE